jgi:hypothetical protein
VRLGILRVQLRRAARGVEGVIKPFLPHAKEPEQRESRGVLGREGKRAANRRLGLDEFLLLELGRGEVAGRDELAFVQREGGRELRLGLGEAAPVEVARGLDEQRPRGGGRGARFGRA